MRKQQVTDKRQANQLQQLMSSRDLQSQLMQTCKTAALHFVSELFREEVERLSGPKFSHKTPGQVWRGGNDMTRVIAGGEKLSVKRPRLRNDDGEVPLSTLTALQDQDIFDDAIKSRMIRGVATRNYEPVIESWAGKLSVKKSTISKAFIRASKKDLDHINSFDLSGYKFVALMIDGVEVATRALIVPLGITERGEKIPLGLAEGDTENSVVIKDLLTQIKGRNFSFCTERGLAVTDGAKAIKKALKDVFGATVVVQRCWLHKLRNIQGYIPKEHHKQLWWRMKKMMGMVDSTAAKKEMATLLTWLSEISIDAERSLEEAGSELLVVHELGISGVLRRSLYTTNPIESLIFGIRHRMARVKNWSRSKKKDQIQRWMASSLIASQKKMNRLRGHRDIQKLITNLNKNIDQQEQSA
jgi:putative transposase